ncbi:M15 family metallopeptidase [Microbacterium sp. NPDC056234]|uniref:M15 family metallopeptidase n=1 Tax=Microbacterium sp. NPDC056234 TaxID=3345757 RepID=UPI0035DDB9BC
MSHPSASRRARRRRALALLGTVAVASAATVAVLQAIPAANGSVLVPTGAPIAQASYQPTSADGFIPENGRPTVFDDTSPAVANLNRELLDALRAAAERAERDGVELRVNSGWRAPEYQQWLLDNATAEYGSSEEAARWVATPSTSAHVTGDAVDLGPDSALDWLSQHGDRFGLCQIYANERWHYELRPDAEANGCPRMYADPTDDPRMQS